MVNKIDSVSMETLDVMAREGDGRTVMISCELDLGLDWLLERVWQELGLVKCVPSTLLIHAPHCQGVHEETRGTTRFRGPDLPSIRVHNRNCVPWDPPVPRIALQVRIGVGEIEQIQSSTTKGRTDTFRAGRRRVSRASLRERTQAEEEGSASLQNRFTDRLAWASRTNQVLLL